jgi:hypothetical protein
MTRLETSPETETPGSVGRPEVIEFPSVVGALPHDDDGARARYRCNNPPDV